MASQYITEGNPDGYLVFDSTTGKLNYNTSNSKLVYAYGRKLTVRNAFGIFSRVRKDNSQVRNRHWSNGVMDYDSGWENMKPTACEVSIDLYDITLNPNGNNSWVEASRTKTGTITCALIADSVNYAWTDSDIKHEIGSWVVNSAPSTIYGSISGVITYFDLTDNSNFSTGVSNLVSESGETEVGDGLDYEIRESEDDERYTYDQKLWGDLWNYKTATIIGGKPIIYRKMVWAN